MSTVLNENEVFDEDSAGTGPAAVPDHVEVRRHAGVAAGVGLTASAVAIAYLGRASQSGSTLDWVFVAVMGLLGAYWLVGLVDARTPLLVADAQGIRIRLGRTWRGLPWTAVHHVEHTPRKGLLRDGRLVVVPHNLELIEAELTGAGKRHTSLSRLLHGAPLAVPLGLSTRVVGADGDLTEALGRVARDASQIVVLETEVEHSEDVVDETVVEESVVEESVAEESVAEETVEPRVASPTPLALRETGAGRRSEVRRDVVEDASDDEPAGRELHRPGRVSLVEETQSWGDRVRAIARPGEPVEPLVLDDFEVEPAEDPVIGPELAAARTRLGLTVDQLADRTRIRPHVIEAVEVDDFEPCGGDFYARGHLRTLARVLGIDVAPLLATYDERYAHAPINPRRVFEAELATGVNGSIRSTRGGPNWSVLVAVVMALVLAWSVARLVMDTPPELRGATPVLNGSGGPQGAGNAPLAEAVPVVVSAASGGAKVVVRDGAGEVVFKGSLAVGQSRELKASPPVRVQSTDGAVTVSLAGGEARPVGEPGVAGQGTFVAS
ncbi:helix-turn-helix domain-containing protein [Nocardioides ganghwensis]|uniref:Helix-turn-helix domain-containing protein n=1 Tax=Nocardioides ganghwensis TaxID=252230 RepID=A0A4Q2SE83_9ACTN|nr:helix-turn-helix domain-containing protein [Nocardioides ganghwensis]MBD3945204.1 helix-turn-helix domain-containing protein [Nocardioides ganghwensis]RYC03635.1 helix-turn-helix domain-containing protein [Nocardioides ganghwensis]